MITTNNPGACTPDVARIAISLSLTRELGEFLPLVAGAKWSPYSYGGFGCDFNYFKGSECFL
jgi:hypothetical protein